MKIQSTFRDMVIQSFLKWGEFLGYLHIFLGIWDTFQILKGIWDTRDPTSKASLLALQRSRISIYFEHKIEFIYIPIYLNMFWGLIERVLLSTQNICFDNIILSRSMR